MEVLDHVMPREKQKKDVELWTAVTGLLALMYRTPRELFRSHFRVVSVSLSGVPLEISMEHIMCRYPPTTIGRATELHTERFWLQRCPTREFLDYVFMCSLVQNHKRCSWEKPCGDESH